MSTAAITINQSGKPAGVSNQSRDDLDLYTAPGTEIQLSNSGVGGTTFQWSIIDQPPGAAATLTTPLLSTTLLTGATVAGSYLVQLVVDGGGSIGQIKRLIGAVQVNTPSWVTPALNRPLRIPACGETNEFNVETSPGVGVNLRGWAQEMSHFFLTIANFAFGSVIKSNNVQVGAEAFLTFNFSTAFTVSDAGSGQANIGLAGSVGGLTALQNAGGAVAGSPFTTLNAVSPDVALASAYFPNQDVQFENQGANVGKLIGTSGRHGSLAHSPGILLGSGVTTAGFASTINTGSNPMTVSVAALNAGGAGVAVMTNGRVATPTQLPAGFTVSLAAPVSTTRTLYDVYLKSTDLTLDLYVLAQTLSANVPAIVIQTSPNLPTGSYNLAVDGSGNWSFGGGAALFQDVSLVTEVLRLYLPNGIDWVDVYRYSTSGAASDSWTVNAVNPNGYLPIFRAPYWLNPTGSVATWGWASSGSQKLVDTRPYGAEGLSQLQDSVLKRIDLLGADQGFDFGVVFAHKRTTQATIDQGMDGFALTTAGGAAPANATGITGGAVWIRGRRYEIHQSTLFSGLGLINTYGVVGVTVGPNQQPVVTAVSTGSVSGLITFIRNQLLRLKVSPTGQDVEETVFCPLYFGNFNGSSVMLVDERLDLRRNVGKLNTWTVGSRSYDAQTAITGSLQGSVAFNTNLATDYFQSEFESVGAALLWHGVITGSNNLDRAGGTLDNPPTKLDLVRDTYETYPITLWNNVSLVGRGKPAVTLLPRGNSAFHGGGYLWVGAPVSLSAGSGNQLVYSVEISGVKLVASAITGSGVGTEILKINAPKWDNTQYSNVKQPYASVKDVLIRDVELIVSNGAGYVSGSGMSGIRSVYELGAGAFSSGYMSNVRFDNVALEPTAFDSTGASSWLFTDYGIHFSGTLVAPQVFSSDNVSILNSTLKANLGSLRFTSAGQSQLQIRNNILQVASTASGKVFESNDSKMQDVNIADNTLTLAATIATAYGFEFTNGPLNRFNLQRNSVTLSTLANSLGIACFVSGSSISNAKISKNYFANFRTGFSLGAMAMSSVDGNQVVIGTGTFDGASRGLIQSGVQTDLRITDNSFSGFREGLNLTGTGASQGIYVSGNDIRGQIDYVTEGSFHARGIRYNYSGAVPSSDIGLVIHQNLIQDLVGDAGASDLSGMPGGGIIIGASGKTDVYLGVVVTNNTVRANHGVSRTSLSTMWFSGIYLGGAFPGAQIVGNQIVNNDTKFNDTAHGNSGIAIENSVAYAGVVDAGAFISDNEISLMNVNAVDSSGSPVWDKQAAILLVGRSDFSVISNNLLKLQCRLENPGGRYGYLHGILLGTITPLTGAAQKVTIRGNTIDGCTVDSSVATPGTVGAAIQVCGNAVDVDIAQNTVKGVFVAHPSYTLPALTSYVTVAVEATAAHSNVKVAGNTITGLSSAAVSGVPGVQLGAGIRVGSQSCATSTLVSITNNHIDVPLNSAAMLTRSGAIVLEALDAGVTVVGTHAQISNNFVRRVDEAGVQRSRGIRVNGYNYGSFRANKVVHIAGQAAEIEDVSGTGSVVANNWGNNHVGAVGLVGSSALGALVYLADPVPGPSLGTNTDGASFF